ncbi:MAG: hypothetical protein MUC79_12265 [Thiobacillaceae bacterium]|jgi:hypothetical protein|nr:hypothetical protein [Thiobacillaceae bacterium]
MQRIRILAFLFAGATGTALAGTQDLAEIHVGGQDTCPALMTEAECRVHHDILGLLPAGPERSAYLAMHAQLLEDRQAACRCGRGGDLIGMLRRP